MMNKTIFLFLLLLTTLYAKDFNIIIKKPLQDSLFDITEDLTNSFTAVGFTTHYIDREEKIYTDPYSYLESNFPRNGINLFMVQVNKYAEIIQEKSIPLSYASKAKAIVKTVSNGYIVGTQNTDGTLSVLRINKNLLLQNKVTFGTSNKNQLNKMIALEDEGVLCIGTSYSSRAKEKDIFERGLDGDDIYIAKFSKHLRKLWAKKIGTLADEMGIDAIELQDGTFIVVTNYIKKRKKYVKLYKLTENGDVLWKEDVASTSLQSHKILQLQDETILLLLNEKHNSKEIVKIYNYSKEGEQLFTKELPFKYSISLYDMQEFSNTNLVAVGKWQHKGNSDGFIVLLNREFHILKQHHLGSTNYDSFYALDILRNSQIAVSGLHRDASSQQSNMWLLKFNADISPVIIPKKKKKSNKRKSLFSQDTLPCCKINSLQNKQPISQPKKIKTFFTTLYFQQGKYKLTQKNKHKIDAISKKLMPMLLKNRNKIKYLEISGFSSSEWHTKDFKSRYLKNASLSNKRSYEVLHYFFMQQTKKNQHFLSKILKSSSQSFSHPLYKNNQEDKKHSRRVTFKIVFF